MHFETTTYCGEDAVRPDVSCFVVAYAKSPQVQHSFRTYFKYSSAAPRDTAVIFVDDLEVLAVISSGSNVVALNSATSSSFRTNHFWDLFNMRLLSSRSYTSYYGISLLLVTFGREHAPESVLNEHSHHCERARRRGHRRRSLLIAQDPKSQWIVESG